MSDDPYKNLTIEEILSRIPHHGLMADLARESLRLQAEALTGYPHRTGIGDKREAMVLDFLRRRLPATVETTKGHVADSDGRITSEFDVVLYDPSARLLIAEGTTAHKVVPVECVQAVVEVRSQLDSAAVADAQAKVDELSQLVRYYRPTHVANLLEIPAFSSSGYGATENCICALPILPYLVGFDGVAAATLEKSLNEREAEFEGVLRIGSYYGSHPSDKTGYSVTYHSHLSISPFITSIVGHLMNFATYRNLAIPCLDRYS